MSSAGPSRTKPFQWALRLVFRQCSSLKEAKMLLSVCAKDDETYRGIKPLQTASTSRANLHRMSQLYFGLCHGKSSQPHQTLSVLQPNHSQLPCSYRKKRLRVYQLAQTVMPHNSLSTFIFNKFCYPSILLNLSRQTVSR